MWVDSSVQKEPVIRKKNLIITVKATQVDDQGMTRSDRIIEREREAL